MQSPRTRDKSVPHEGEPSFAAILQQERRQLWWRRSQIGAVLALVLVCAALIGLFDVKRLSDGLPAIGALLAEMLPPDFSNVTDWIRPVVDTLAMSIAGTALAIGLSLPLALCAARHIAPHRIVYVAARTLLNILRAIPELIMGIVFVAAVGFGTLPGVLALGLRSVGMVGKFFAESIEHAHEAPIEAARAAGARPFQIITHGIWPQVMPHCMDVIMYRWEYNFRASTVMGMVGAGGIGLELMSCLRLMRYREVCAILLVILAAVSIVDWLSSELRKRFQ